MTDDRSTRGRVSKVKQLPDDIRAQLNMMLRDGSMTQQQILTDINALIAEAGLAEEFLISSSGLNRYATQIEAVGKEMREIREVTDAWVARLGDKPTGEVSKLLVEMLRTQSFRMLMKFQADPDAVMDSEQLGELALAIQRMERASMLTHEREKELRKEFAAQAAAIAEKTAKQQGVSSAGISALREAIMSQL